MEHDNDYEEPAPSTEDSDSTPEMSEERRKYVEKMRKIYAQMHITHMSLLGIEDDDIPGPSEEKSE